MSSIAPGSSPAPRPAPHPAPPVRPAQVLRSPQGTATALTALLSVGAAAALLSAGLDLREWQQMKQVLADPVGVDHSGMASGEYLNAFLGLAQNALMLATAVVFIVWFHRVRHNAGVFRPDGFSQSAGWAIGGWFVPVANLFLPYRTARETWDASTQYATDGSYRQVSGAPVVAWWLVFAASRVLDVVSGWKHTSGETTEQARDAYSFSVFADLTTVAAAVLAVVFVRKLTAMQGAKAAQGPNAAV